MLENKLEVTFDGATSPTFTAYQYYQQGTPTAIYLEELVGWDEDDTLAIKTEQKLTGEGEYVIAFTRGAKIIQVTLNVLFSSQSSLRTFRTNLVTQMLSQTTVNLKRVYKEGTTTSDEEINGYVTSVSKWDQTDLLASIRFTVHCPEPSFL